MSDKDMALAVPAPGLRPDGAEPAPQSQAEPLVPSAEDHPFSFAWTDDFTPEARAIALVRSMAAQKVKNKYPVGVFGHVARAHYDEARNIVHALASGIETEGQDAKRLGAKPESPTGKAGDAK